MRVITSKKDLAYFLAEDRKRIKIKSVFLQWISKGELYTNYIFSYHLRKTEYYLNKRKKPWDYLPLMWHAYRHRSLKLKYNCYISPNCVGPGFYVVHPGFLRIGEYVRIGQNCTVLPMVLIGKKDPSVDPEGFTIGDNCYISTGVTILGPLKIGNNVVIAAGSVVTKDIPDNCTVAGVPAKIIKEPKLLKETS